MPTKLNWCLHVGKNNKTKKITSTNREKMKVVFSGAVKRIIVHVSFQWTQTNLCYSEMEKPYESSSFGRGGLFWQKRRFLKHSSNFGFIHERLKEWYLFPSGNCLLQMSWCSSSPLKRQFKHTNCFRRIVCENGTEMKGEIFE